MFQATSPHTFGFVIHTIMSPERDGDLCYLAHWKRGEPFFSRLYFACIKKIFIPTKIRFIVYMNLSFEQIHKASLPRRDVDFLKQSISL